MGAPPVKAPPVKEGGVPPVKAPPVKAGGAPPVEEVPPPAKDAGAAPHAVLVARAADHPRDGVTFMWGPFKFTTRWNRVTRERAGYKVICPFHEPTVPCNSRTGYPIPCSREIHFEGAAEDASSLDILKYWCVRAKHDNAGCRDGHMRRLLFPPREAPPPGTDLDAMLSALPVAPYGLP